VFLLSGRQFRNGLPPDVGFQPNPPPLITVVRSSLRRWATLQFWVNDFPRLPTLTPQSFSDFLRTRFFCLFDKTVVFISPTLRPPLPEGNENPFLPCPSLTFLFAPALFLLPPRSAWNILLVFGCPPPSDAGKLLVINAFFVPATRVFPSINPPQLLPIVRVQFFCDGQYPVGIFIGDSHNTPAVPRGLPSTIVIRTQTFIAFGLARGAPWSGSQNILSSGNRPEFVNLPSTPVIPGCQSRFLREVLMLSPAIFFSFFSYFGNLFPPCPLPGKWVCPPLLVSSLGFQCERRGS